MRIIEQAVCAWMTFRVMGSWPVLAAGREFLLLEVPDTSNIAPTQEQLRSS